MGAENPIMSCGAEEFAPETNPAFRERVGSWCLNRGRIIDDDGAGERGVDRIGAFGLLVPDTRTYPVVGSRNRNNW